MLSPQLTGVRDNAAVEFLDTSLLSEDQGSPDSEPERKFNRINLRIVDRDLTQNFLHVARVVLVCDLGHKLIDLFLLELPPTGPLHGGRKIVGDATHELGEGVKPVFVPHTAVDNVTSVVPGAHYHLGHVKLNVTGKHGVVAQALEKVVEGGGNVLTDKEVHNPTPKSHFVDIAKGFQAFHGFVKVYRKVEELGVAGRDCQLVLQEAD
ncbi:14.1 kDa early protein [Human adenovirus 41]|uniref:14.1 kDa early protein n=1 Tax=Human adenovirus F serotype 41 TaxID=10524 RepID=A0A7U3NJG0_ADE41|nr:14.1 kDa early protein [Human adenovirus 41]